MVSHGFLRMAPPTNRCYANRKWSSLQVLALLVSPIHLHRFSALWCYQLVLYAFNGLILVQTSLQGAKLWHYKETLFGYMCHSITHFFFFKIVKRVWPFCNLCHIYTAIYDLHGVPIVLHVEGSPKYTYITCMYSW